MLPGTYSPPAGFCLVSGVFDLRPIQQSYVNEACKMSEKEAIQFSPMLRSKENVSSFILNGKKKIPIIIAVGEHDSPKFKKQSKIFYEKLLMILSQADITSEHVSFIEMPGEDHFTSIERLEEKEYILTKKILQTLVNISKEEKDGAVVRF